MTTAKTAASPDDTAGKAIRWVSRGMEFLWLLTVVAVPLAFVDRESFLSELELAYVDVPKTVLLRTLVGLLAVLWLIEWVLQHWIQSRYHSIGQFQDRRPQAWLKTLSVWLQTNPGRWVTLAVALYLGSTLLGTALSESLSVSMWGLVPGQDTYPAYTIASYVLLFGAIAAHVKSQAQAQRLIWSIVVMGVLVGGYSWSQYYGHDVFNLREIPGGRQSGSTLGNNILAGSVLLMTITVSLAAATLAVGQPVRRRRYWGNLGLWTAILTVQLTALLFSSGRGPWVGTVGAQVVLLGLVGVFLGWRTLGRTALMLSLAAGLTAVITLWPPPIPPGEPVTIKTEYSGRQYLPPADVSPLAQTAPSEALSIGREVVLVGRGVREGGLSGRIRIWETSGRLITERPWFEFDRPSLSFLRPVIGYGPDMFKYTYLLARVPGGPEQYLVSERFAHNLLIHKWVELGFLGLLTSIGLFAAPAIVVVYCLFRRKRGESTFYDLVLAGLLAALAGRFLEQMVGVAAVSDLTIFWGLMALFAALPAAAGVSWTATHLDPASPQRGANTRLVLPATMGRFGARTVLPAVLVVCLIAGIGVLTWTKSIHYLEAGFKARDGLEDIRNARFQSALVSLDRAIDLTPDVSLYHTLRAAVYSGYRRQDDGPREPECARLAESGPYQACLSRMSYLSNRDASELRPLDWQLRLNLADSALTLASIDRDSGMAGEAVGLYLEVAGLDPHAWQQWERLAEAHMKVGDPRAALVSLEKSLTILDGTPRSAYSRLLQGIAYLTLNQAQTAAESFDEAIRIKPDFADAYTNRGASRNALGKYRMAIQDLDRAIQLNPNVATAYNNRGNSYGNLDQLERAIEDYGQAIRLDPKFALAYSNRALAYTYLGEDDEARSDVERIVELGLDPESIIGQIEELKNNR